MPRPPRPRRFVSFTGFAALLLWSLLLATAGSAVAQTLRFSHALAVESDAPHFPDAPTPRLVALPDDWAASRPGARGPVWYRVVFDARGVRERGEPQALLIDRVCSRFDVWINQQLVHRSGRADTATTRNCQQPVLVTLPAGLLVAQGNVLDLKVEGLSLAEVASRQRAAGLSTMDIGPYGPIADRHARHVAWRTTLPEVITATLLLLGGFMFLLGWRNRAQSYMAYFGALCVGWSLVTSRLWVREIDLPPWQVEVLLCAVVAFVAFCAVQFLLRYAGRRSWPIKVAMAVQCVLVPVTLVIGGREQLFAVASTWYALLALQSFAAVVAYLRITRREQPDEFWPMAVLTGATTVMVVAEFVAQQSAPGNVYGELSHVAIPLLLVAIGLRLVQHYGGALRESEADRVSLEARIREATAEIERNFAQLAELRVEQVTERERKRIAADLHDDLGAKLLTIVHTSESERISTLAREALEEMRLSVRGLTGRPVRLIDALGDWRAEVVSRLAQAGVEAEWGAPAEEPPQTLSARAYVQTTRILREAVSNIIKHSGASHCSVRCAIDGGDFQLVVQDNGRGIPMELDGRLDRGHGMSSMKHRAKQLQGQCLVESGPGYGTVIRLTLPL